MNEETPTGPVCPTCEAPWTKGHICTTGADLAAERIAAGIKTKAELARRLGVSKAYVGDVEKQPVPTKRARKLYRAALGEAAQ